MTNTRQLAAIMFTDIQGYTSLMQKSEASAVELRQSFLDILTQETARFSGRIINYYGDGALSIFESAVSAVKCGCAMQKKFLDDTDVPVRIGIHMGDIMVTDIDVIGDPVNIASRIESIGVAGSVLISGTVYQEIKNHTELTVESMGHFYFKNDSGKREVFAMDLPGLIVPDKDSLEGKTQQGEEKKANIWESLWKRGVPQVLGGYLVATWAIIMFVDWLLNRYQISSYWTEVLLVLFLTMIPSVLLFIYNRERIKNAKLSLLEKITFPSNILFTAVLLTGIFWGRDLGAMTDTVTVKDEYGKEKDVEVYKSDFINRILLFSFKNEIKQDTIWTWLGNGIMFGINEDLSQFNYMLTEYEAGALHFQEKVTLAKGAHFPHYIDGTYKVENDTFTISYNVRLARNGNIKENKEFSGPDLFNLLDIISRQIRLDLDIPKNIIDSYPDIPLNEQTTSNIKAYEVFCGHINAEFGSNEYNMPLLNALELDSTFALAQLLYLKRILFYGNRTNLIASRLIEQTYLLKSKFSDWRQRDIEMLNFLLHNQEENAIERAEDQCKLQPYNITFLNQLIYLYEINLKTEKLEEAYIKYGELFPGDPSWKLKLANSYLLTENPRKIKQGLELLEDYKNNYPEDVEALMMLSEFYLQLHEWQSAKEVIEKAISLSPPDEWDRRSKIYKAIEFARSNEPSEDFFKKFIGEYRMEYSFHTTKRFILNNALYSKPLNQIGGFHYFDTDSSCLSITGWNTKKFVIKDNKVIKAEGYQPNFKGLYSISWKEDSLITNALDQFEQGNARKALIAFKNAKIQNPEHYYLDYYINHLEFNLSSDYADYKQIESSYPGEYSGWKIVHKFGELMIILPDYKMLNMKPLSANSYFTPEDYRTIYSFTSQNGIPGLMVYANGSQGFAPRINIVK